MSKSFKVPTTSKELENFIGGIIGNSSKHGVNVYCIMGYSQMMGHIFCIDSAAANDITHLSHYIECASAFMSLFEDTLRILFGQERARELMITFGQKIIDGDFKEVFA